MPPRSRPSRGFTLIWKAFFCRNGDGSESSTAQHLVIKWLDFTQNSAFIVFRFTKDNDEGLKEQIYIHRLYLLGFVLTTCALMGQNYVVPLQ